MAKILLVEDDPLISRMYQNAFTFEKYEVLVALDGEKGLELAKTNTPDLILLDIMLPNMNGLDVLEQLKADEKTKNLPVIMLTNIAGNQALETAISKGALMYIIKSEFDPKQVVETVRKALAGEVKSQQNPPTAA
jgi:two-component system, OmpR family, alkaline phosphatase synthesis response regulator PhoP